MNREQEAMKNVVESVPASARAALLREGQTSTVSQRSSLVDGERANVPGRRAEQVHRCQVLAWRCGLTLLALSLLLVWPTTSHAQECTGSYWFKGSCHEDGLCFYAEVWCLTQQCRWDYCDGGWFASEPESTCSGECDFCEPGNTRPCTPASEEFPCGTEACGDYNQWSGNCTPTDSCRTDKCLSSTDPDCCAEHVGPHSINLATGEVTYSPNWADAEVRFGGHSFVIQRRYSTIAALQGAARENGAPVDQQPRSWGSGWYHDFEHVLTHPPLSGYVYRWPSGETELFDSNGHGTGHPTITLAIVSTTTATVRLDDGRLLAFEATASGWTLAQLVKVTNPDGTVVDLSYYSAGGSSPCNSASKTRPTDYVGRLCRAQFRISEGGTVLGGAHFAEYGRTECVQDPICTECTGTDCSMGQPTLQLLTFGVGDDVDAYASQTSYTFQTTARLDRVGGPHIAHLTTTLTGASQVVNSTEVNGQTYTYTEYTYARPDLGSGGNPYATSHPLVFVISGSYSYEVSAPLLRHIRDGSGEFVEGYEYSDVGRGAAAYSAGEVLRIQYAYGTGQTIVFNESTGSQIAYTIDTGRVQAISDSCGCSGQPASFERENGSPVGKVLAEVDLSGVRTRYFRDQAGRATLVLKNWTDSLQDPAPDVDDLREDPSSLLSGHVRVRRYAFGSADAPTVPTVESRVASSMCPLPSGVSWSVSCPSSWGEPRIERILGTNSVMENEARYGLTLSGLGTGSSPVEFSAAERDKTYDYDSYGNLVSVTDEAGGMVIYTYYGTGSGVAANDRGQIATIEWQGPGEQSPSALLEVREDYNERGLPTSVTRLGEETELVFYDGAGRLIKRVAGAAGHRRVTVYSYLANGRLAYVARGPEGTTNEIDPSGSVTQTISYSEGTNHSPTSTDFCETQNVGDIGAAQEDCLEDLVALGKPISEASGTNLGVSFVQAERTETTYSRDPLASLRKRYLETSQSPSRVAGLQYDAAGRLIRRMKYTNSDSTASAVADYGFDIMGRNTKVVDERFGGAFQGGQPPDYATNLNAANRLMAYDALGRVSTVTVGNGTSEEAVTHYEYDVHDNLIKVEDADGRVTRYLYDDFDRLVLVASPDSGITRYEYDAVGNLVMKKDGAGILTHYEYDSRYRLRKIFYNYDPQESPPATADVEYVYDSAALTSQSTSCELVPESGHYRGLDVNQGYVTGRLSWVRHGGGRTYYSYTAFGEIAATYEYGIDAAPTNVCDLVVTAYTYDGAGRVTGITYPSGRRLRYVYASSSFYPTSVALDTPDGEGDFTSTTVFSSLSYDIGGMLAGFDVDSEVGFIGTWDYDGQAVERAYTSAAALGFDWHITLRDPSGNIKTVHDEETPKQLALDYDGQDRLMSAVGTSLRGYQDYSEFVYDLAGNRVADTCYDKQISYEPVGTTNVLDTMQWTPTACGSNPDPVFRDFNPDPLGRVTTAYGRRFPLPADAATLTYDGAGNIASATTIGPVETFYSYDHRNLRVAKVGPSVSARFVYDPSGRLIGELPDQPTAEKMDYIYLGSEPVAVIVDPDGDASTGSSVYILGTDHLGTPMRAFDASNGEITWAADYEAFGRAWEYVPDSREAPSIEINLRFPGQYLDRETGLHYNWHRYYDPDTGRYLQPDPVLTGIENLPPMVTWLAFDSGAANPYAYAMNTPLVVADPSGLGDPGSCQMCTTMLARCYGFCSKNPDWDNPCIAFPHPYCDPDPAPGAAPIDTAACRARCDAAYNKCTADRCGIQPACGGGG